MTLYEGDELSRTIIFLELDNFLKVLKLRMYTFIFIMVLKDIIQQEVILTIFWCLYFSYLSQEECAGTSSNVVFLGAWLVDFFCNLPYFSLKLPQTFPFFSFWNCCTAKWIIHQHMEVLVCGFVCVDVYIRVWAPLAKHPSPRPTLSALSAPVSFPILL